MQFAVNLKHKKKISMTALVDVVFLLLIFFMLTTNFVDQRGINLMIPDKTGAKSSWQGAILIRPNKNGVVRINATKVKITELTDKLKSMLNVSKNKKIIVQPYEQVDLQTLVSVLDKVRYSGATEISLIK